MLTALSNHVLWKEMRDICSLGTNFLTKNKDIKTLPLGGNIYVDKCSITDPLLKLEVENCHILNGYYPLSVLAIELGLTDHETKQLRKSEHTILFYKTHLFKIPNIFLNSGSIKNKTIIHSLISEDCEDCYDTVVRINSKFKIDSYSF